MIVCNMREYVMYAFTKRSNINSKILVLFYEMMQRRLHHCFTFGKSSLFVIPMEVEVLLLCFLVSGFVASSSVPCEILCGAGRKVGNCFKARDVL